mmetsp:Transcript_3224/g.12753  ORF Transcript_3224/g.12753 Transcript_3224/m.12753 type:complete len:379 (+) Transcript_3224:2152-3288(+)
MPGVVGSRGPRGGMARQGGPALGAARSGGDDHQAAHVGAPGGSSGSDVGHPVLAGARRERLHFGGERAVAVRRGPQNVLQGPRRGCHGAGRLRVRRDAEIQPRVVVGDANVPQASMRFANRLTETHRSRRLRRRDRRRGLGHRAGPTPRAPGVHKRLGRRGRRVGHPDGVRGFAGGRAEPHGERRGSARFVVAHRGGDSRARPGQARHPRRRPADHAGDRRAHARERDHLRRRRARARGRPAGHGRGDARASDPSGAPSAPPGIHPSRERGEEGHRSGGRRERRRRPRGQATALGGAGVGGRRRRRGGRGEGAALRRRRRSRRRGMRRDSEVFRRRWRRNRPVSGGATSRRRAPVWHRGVARRSVRRRESPRLCDARV